MKNTKSLSRTTKTATAGFTLMLIATLFFASCKKEESQQPESTQTSAVEDQPTKQATQESYLAFLLININHISFNASTPEYSVSVAATGLVTYEGRNNVRVKGTHTFKATASQLKRISSLCRLLTSNDEGRISTNEKAIPEQSYVVTSITNRYTPFPKFFIDYNNGIPANVVAFRTQLELTLGLSKYVEPDSNLQVATEEK